MNEEVLKQAGLSDDQALIYKELLKSGPLKAGAINKKTPLKRGLVYKVLDQLIDLNLVEKVGQPGETATFKPKHPLQLKTLLEQKAQQTREAAVTLEATLPSLVSEFNLISGRPGVEYYEGVEGVKKVALDSLNATSEILQFVDVEAVEKYYKEINEEYIKERQKLNKKKRIIVTGSDYNKEYFSKLHDKLTDARYINYNMQDFGAMMMIYDNKISYITLHPEYMMGVIIENPLIAKMQRQLFNYTWITTKAAL